jgi:UDP-N-acetylglucosamine 2-epimerase (non-hydrolysing)
MMRGAIDNDGTRMALELQPNTYGVVTLHRPSNVDSAEALTVLVDQLAKVSARLPLVFAVHPRTRKRLTEFGLYRKLAAAGRVTLVDPLGYIQFMNLVTGARLVVTDSGGVQEETTYLGISCLTLRENTERPITVTEGSNRLVQPAQLLKEVDRALATTGRLGRRPGLWDGHAAERAVESLMRRSTPSV